MTVYKCDICKKEIKDKKSDITISQYLRSNIFCAKCAKPVTSFLEKHKLLEVK
jgi:DNA-directed RNA polymerase subunit RPC12/RpoP